VASIISVLQLEQIRRGTGISLQAISESTKITTTYLRAIESEEFEKLPGGVFNTSYIRQYAAAIGFPEVELLALYHAKTAAAEESAATATAVLPPRSSGVLRSCLNWLRNPSPLAR
jgi:cytoskeletal protein RodZ